ncbi:Acyl-CoA dehydrogenase [Amycolatopsis xylanica]|uniref:Acyl-CoA dehydrogenase n=1 Tax=Amycolatopsis xylanica TaxID=589385 RepID=A0A1H2VEF9_9PSEU|nr:acyl-CoA dehydrogenase family protein [Amycolatopsis xylanica]SDW66702.1 Acyl-CoA dehydrogenase [Amycolatopsis xylanica]
MTALLAALPPKPPSDGPIEAELRALAAADELDLPLPGGGGTAKRWAALAGLGRRDLALARLAEGHTDALAILAEAGHAPADGALYGVWAAKSEGTGATLDDGALSGTVRFCSGASFLDRALVVAGDRLAEVDLAHPGVQRHPGTWQAIGMADSDSGDVVFDRVPVDALIGGPDWYVTRPGFWRGGGGVAAVWLGGAAGIADAVLAYLTERGRADEHQLAHLGALHASLRSAEALLLATAELFDGDGDADAVLPANTCRAAVERTVREVLDRAPKITGPTLMCRDRVFAQKLADLLVYVRQHHAERDLAWLGRLLLEQDR